MMAKREWLDSLKAGDEVLYSAGWGTVQCIETVERTTATQIILGRAKFRRKDGGRVGGASHRYGFIREPTDADREKFERERLQRNIDAQWKAIAHRDTLPHIPIQLLRDLQSTLVKCMDAYHEATAPDVAEEE